MRCLLERQGSQLEKLASALKHLKRCRIRFARSLPCRCSRPTPRRKRRTTQRRGFVKSDVSRFRLHTHIASIFTESHPLDLPRREGTRVARRVRPGMRGRCVWAHFTDLHLTPALGILQEPTPSSDLLATTRLTRRGRSQLIARTRPLALTRLLQTSTLRRNHPGKGLLYTLVLQGPHGRWCVASLAQPPRRPDSRAQRKRSRSSSRRSLSSPHQHTRRCLSRSSRGSATRRVATSQRSSADPCRTRLRRPS